MKKLKKQNINSSNNFNNKEKLKTKTTHELIEKDDFLKLNKKIKEEQIYIPKEGPPKSRINNNKIYKEMGENNFYKMAEDFYNLLSQSKIKNMFPKDPIKLKEASRKTGKFLIQLSGGPKKYTQSHGKPKMREAHLRFKITKSSQEEWLNCFLRVLKKAPKKYNFPEDEIEQFKKVITEISIWMINKK